MSNFDVFLELLKLFLIGFEIVRYFLNRKKEKELALLMTQLNQSLKLEKSSKEKSLGD
jgi:hypothetical protein